MDDDESVLRLFNSYFIRFDNIQFDATSRPEHVPGYLEEHPEVDIVISDIRMPLLDGWELLRQIKEKFPLITVILYSGDPVLIESRGAVEPDFTLKKPFSIQEMAKILNSITRQKF